MARLAPTRRLRGREEELKALGDAFDRTALGHPTAVIVEGEAGIGKTRLLADALDDARARGLQVIAGRAQELERTRPFGVLADSFACTASSPDPRRRAIAALLATHLGDRGPLTVSSDPGLQFQAVDALVDLIESLALRGPLVVGLDDLQWADPSSLLTLGTLGARLADVPLALVGCLRLLPRPLELRRALEALDADGARRLTIGPLGDDAVADLVAEVVAAAPGQRLLAGVAGAGGNPLFVTELVGALLQEGGIQIADGRAEVAEMTLPPTLPLTILRRLSLLPEDTLRALRAASILGSGFTLPDLSTTTATSALELASVLAEAIRARVLEDDGERLRFRHDLLREALYEDLPASVRLALHREAGQRLARANAPALQVAEHLARGAGRGDSEAIAWLIRAARETAPSSPGVAAELLEWAIGLTGLADPGRDGLLAERAGALILAGRLADAGATCRELCEHTHDPSVEAQARIGLGWIAVAEGRMRDALRELEPVHQAPALGDQARATAWGWASMAHLSLGDLDSAAAAAEQARPAAASVGDHATTSLALTCLAVVSEFRGDLGKAVGIIDDAARLADQSPGRQGHRYPLHVTRGHILLELDRLEDARSTLVTGSRLSEELGVRWALPSYQVFLAVERFAAGAWDDAVAEYEAALELAEEIGERYSLVLAHSVRSLIALHRDELRTAEEAAAAAARELEAGGPRYRSHWAMWARALLQEAQGATGAAFATLDSCWDLCARSGLAIEYPALGGRPRPPRPRRRQPGAGGAGGGRGRGDGGPQRRRLPDLRRTALPGTGRGRPRDPACGRGRLRQGPPPAGAGPRLRGRRRGLRPPGRHRRRRGPSGAGPGRLREPGGRPRHRPGRGQAPRAGGSPRPPGCPQPPPDRLGQPHPDRAPGGRPGRRGAHQPPDRRAPLCLAPDGPDASRPRVRQAGDLLAGPARRRGGQASTSTSDVVDPTTPTGPEDRPAGGCLPRAPAAGSMACENQATVTSPSTVTVAPWKEEQ